MTLYDDVDINVTDTQSEISDYGSNSGRSGSVRRRFTGGYQNRDRIRRICGELLPRVAAVKEWPIVHDHCFYRVAYDMGCSERWDGKYDGSPAYEALGKWDLKRAVDAAEMMLFQGRFRVAWFNVRSLYYRGELGHYPHECPVVCLTCGYHDDGTDGSGGRSSPVIKTCPVCGDGVIPDYGQIDAHHQYGD